MQFVGIYARIFNVSQKRSINTVYQLTILVNETVRNIRIIGFCST